ncbi:hypothetical protein [Dendronalium sp. ChiSLP03b]|uniref:hypothetical protein n=1 Tax=Dendronalium sp. ChiSLP03b TaxID=3075381 RepID=UPI00391CE693
MEVPSRDCLDCQAIANKKARVEALTQLRNAALDSAVPGMGIKTCGDCRPSAFLL